MRFVFSDGVSLLPVAMRAFPSNLLSNELSLLLSLHDLLEIISNSFKLISASRNAESFVSLGWSVRLSSWRVSSRFPLPICSCNCSLTLSSPFLVANPVSFCLFDRLFITFSSTSICVALPEKRLARSSELFRDVLSAFVETSLLWWFPFAVSDPSRRLAGSCTSTWRSFPFLAAAAASSASFIAEWMTGSAHNPGLKAGPVPPSSAGRMSVGRCSWSVLRLLPCR